MQQHRRLLVAFVLPVLLRWTRSEAVPISMQTCWKEMQSAGLTDRFPGAVSHAIHSLTLEDIRFFFDANATENNAIPIVNFDLKADNFVLLDAPLYGTDLRFMTPGLRAVDQVLSNMDNPDFDLARYTILERLVHVLHMQEVWQMTKAHFDKIKSHPPTSHLLCPCVKDVRRNGILKFLSYMSLKIRYPEKMYGKYVVMDKSRPETYQEEIHRESPVKEDSYVHTPYSARTDDGIKVQDSNVHAHLNEDVSLDKSTFKYDFPPSSKPSPDEKKYQWDGNLYTFNFPKDQAVPKPSPSSNENKYQWDGNLYTYYFPKDKPTSRPISSSDEKKYQWDGNLYNYYFSKDQTSPKPGPSSDEKKYEWDGNLYTFNFPKDQPAPTPDHTLNEKKYEWDGNLYNYYFPQDQAVPKASPSSDEKKFQWDGNLYTYYFPKDEPLPKPSPRWNEKKYEWDGNLYTFNFPKDQPVPKPSPSSDEKMYQWNGNLYTFNFPKDQAVPKPSPTSDEKKYQWDGTYNVDSTVPKSSGRARRSSDGSSSSIKPPEPWQYKDEGVSHIKNEAGWQVWKERMLSMEDHDHFEAAMFLYCMLNHS